MIWNNNIGKVLIWFNSSIENCDDIVVGHCKIDIVASHVILRGMLLDAYHGYFWEHWLYYNGTAPYFSFLVLKEGCTWFSYFVSEYSGEMLRVLKPHHRQGKGSILSMLDYFQES